MPANRITTSSASRRRLARSSSLSIGGRSRGRAASGPSFGPRRRFLFALARLSFLFMIGGAERIDVKSRGDRRASPGHHRSAGSPSSQAAYYLAARDCQANHSDARGWLRDALVGGAVPGPTWNRAPHRHRMMPAASSLRDFLVAEGRRFLPNLKHGRRGGKTPAARGNHSAKRK